METTTPQEYTQENVIDLDFGFTFGALQSFTLREGDSYTRTIEGDFVITFRSGQVATIYRHNLAWSTEKQRIILTPKGTPTFKGGATVQSPLSTAH